MAQKFRSTATITLVNGDNTILNIPTPAVDAQGVPQEHFVRKLWLERIDTATEVTLIFKNSDDPAKELLPRITLNADQGKVAFGFGTPFELGVGQNLGLVINASVGSKARVYVEYLTGDNTDWPV